MLGLSVKTLTSHGKYPGQGCDNLELAIQMQFSEKQKTFSDFSVRLLECTSNFKHFEKRYHCPS